MDSDIPQDRCAPPPYRTREEVFAAHYIWWQQSHLRCLDKRKAEGPTLGELARTTGFSRRTCQKLRKAYKQQFPSP